MSFATINSAQVLRDSSNSFRLFDGWGNNVVKYLFDGSTIAADDTTGDPTEWEVTVVEAGAGDSTAVITDVAGGGLLVTTAANENDGWSMQLGAAAGESVKLEGSYPLYCGISLAINDVDQTDFLFGVAVTDTALLGGVTDGVYFRSVDGSAAVNFVTEKDSVESTAAVATMVDDTYVVLEFYFDGSTITAYVDGTEITSLASSAATFPDDEELRLSFEFLTGEATANTCTINWLRMVHVR